MLMNINNKWMKNTYHWVHLHYFYFSNWEYLAKSIFTLFFVFFPICIGNRNAFDVLWFDLANLLKYIPTLFEANLHLSLLHQLLRINLLGFLCLVVLATNILGAHLGRWEKIRLTSWPLRIDIDSQIL